MYNELNPEGKPVSDEEFDQLYYELNPEENPALYTLNNASQEENAELLANTVTDIVKVNPVETTTLDPKTKALINYLDANPGANNRGEILTRLEVLDPETYKGYISALKDSEESQPETEQQPIGILESSEARKERVTKESEEREERITKENIQKVKELFEKNPGEAMARIYATKGDFNRSDTTDRNSLFYTISDGHLNSFIEVRGSDARQEVYDYVSQCVYYVRDYGLEALAEKINSDLEEDGNFYSKSRDSYIGVAQLVVDSTKKSIEYDIKKTRIEAQLKITEALKL